MSHGLLLTFEITILVLAIFLGFEVISKVPTMLHTPLMSGTNAIHGIVIVGAMIVAGSPHQDGADQNDAVNGVGAGHQRRVQRRGHLGDDLDADEDAEDEDRQPDDCLAHELASPSIAARVGSCRISPSWVTQAPATISSSKSGAKTPESPSALLVMSVTMLTMFWA